MDNETENKVNDYNSSMSSFISGIILIQQIPMSLKFDFYF